MMLCAFLGIMWVVLQETCAETSCEWPAMSSSEDSPPQCPALLQHAMKKSEGTVEQKSSYRRVSSARLQPSIMYCTYDNSVGLKGGKSEFFQARDATHCEQACLDNALCSAWGIHFNTGNCYLHPGTYDNDKAHTHLIAPECALNRRKGDAWRTTGEGWATANVRLADDPVLPENCVRVSSARSEFLRVYATTDNGQGLVKGKSELFLANSWEECEKGCLEISYCSAWAFAASSKHCMMHPGTFDNDQNEPDYVVPQCVAPRHRGDQWRNYDGNNLGDWVSANVRLPSDKPLPDNCIRVSTARSETLAAYTLCQANGLSATKDKSDCLQGITEVACEKLCLNKAKCNSWAYESSGKWCYLNPGTWDNDANLPAHVDPSCLVPRARGHQWRANPGSNTWVTANVLLPTDKAVDFDRCLVSPTMYKTGDQIRQATAEIKAAAGGSYHGAYPAADLTNKEGVIFDIADQIGKMCTISEADVLSGAAKFKYAVCSKIPAMVIGHYTGTQAKASDLSNDMDATGCLKLPLDDSHSYFLIGISFPPVDYVGFEGGSFCYAQLRSEHGTGMLTLAPSLIIGNPVVANSGIGRVISTASKNVNSIAMGVSVAPSAGKMTKTFSNDFWNCPGGCSKMSGNIYAGMEIDLTKMLKLDNGLSVSFEVDCLIDFGLRDRANGNSFVSNFVDGISAVGDQKVPSVQSLTNPQQAMDFFRQIMQTRITAGIEGKVTLTLPLEEWSTGLFGDLSLTLGAAQALFKKGDTTGIYLSMAKGGKANTELMDDIQQQILDRFQTDEVKAIVGLLGHPVGTEVTGSHGDKLDLYLTANCVYEVSQTNCNNLAFGLKFAASGFEVSIQHSPHGDFSFCFAIVGVWNSCGGGNPNILQLFNKAGKVIVKVAKELAAATEQAFNEGTTELAKLSEESLKKHVILFEEVSKGAESSAKKVGQWAKDRGSEVVSAAGKMKELFPPPAPPPPPPPTPPFVKEIKKWFR